MNKSLKIILLILQIGGGLLGLGLIGQSLMTKQLTFTTVIIHIAFVFVFLFGIAAGAALLRKRKLGLWLSAVFQAMQIPVITTSLESYTLFSGACFNLYRHSSGFGFHVLVGSRYYFSIHNAESWMAGINFLAFVLFILLVREIRLESIFAKVCESEPSLEQSSRRLSKAQEHQTYGSPLRHILR